MAFNFLQSRIERNIKKIKAKGMLTKENIQDILADIRIILLEADVNVKVVDSFIESIEKKAVNEIVAFDRSSSQVVLKIIYNELVKLLGNESHEWHFQSKSVVMLVGLQGSGKTTTAAKLTNYLVHKKKEYKKPLLVALDIYRPGAIDQLENLAKKIFVDFFANREEKDVEKILNQALDYAKEHDNDLIVIDTAGRLQTNQALMDELVMVKKVAKPSEIIYVLDGMAGQEILNVITEFNKYLKINAAIITKMDSNAKGGSVLSLNYLLKIPIIYIGTGEKISEFQLFHPDRMASRILGLGDIETLTEKAMEVTSEKKQEQLMRKIISGNFDLNDFMYTMKQVNKMGSFSSMSKLMPNLKISETQSESAEEKMNYYQILINSMTNRERKNMRLLKHPKRKNRILKGSGRTTQEYNDLLRNFERAQKQMKELARYFKMGQLPKF